MSPAARRSLLVGALLGLTGVAAGAFGAHGLRSTATPRQLEIWETAAHYQQLHAVVLVAIGLLGHGKGRALGAATVLLLLGVVVFCGSLYTIALGGPRSLGAIAPIGGLSLMAGWAALLAHAIMARREPPGSA